MTTVDTSLQKFLLSALFCKGQILCQVVYDTFLYMFFDLSSKFVSFFFFSTVQGTMSSK